jgi:hypothetical protein
VPNGLGVLLDSLLPMRSAIRTGSERERFIFWGGRERE